MPVVAWTSQLTGFSSHGQELSETTAQAWVDYCNKEYPYIVHKTQ